MGHAMRVGMAIAGMLAGGTVAGVAAGVLVVGMSAAAVGWLALDASDAEPVVVAMAVAEAEPEGAEVDPVVASEPRPAVAPARKAVVDASPPGPRRAAPVPLPRPTTQPEPSEGTGGDLLADEDEWEALGFDEPVVVDQEDPDEEDTEAMADELDAILEDFPR